MMMHARVRRAAPHLVRPERVDGRHPSHIPPQHPHPILLRLLLLLLLHGVLVVVSFIRVERRVGCGAWAARVRRVGRVQPRPTGWCARLRRRRRWGAGVWPSKDHALLRFSRDVRDEGPEAVDIRLQTASTGRRRRVVRRRLIGPQRHRRVKVGVQIKFGHGRQLFFKRGHRIVRQRTRTA